METLGSLLAPRGALGMVLEGSENGVEKRDPPKECGCCYKRGGGSLKGEQEGDQILDRDTGIESGTGHATTWQAWWRIYVISFHFTILCGIPRRLKNVIKNDES